MRRAILFLLILAAPLRSQSLSLSAAGSGNTSTIAVTSSGQFKLVWEAGDNWGLSQWYDLVNDPGATNNLAGPIYSVAGASEPCFAEPGLANMVFYGDSDDKLDMRQVGPGCAYPTATPTMTVVQNNPARMVLQTTAHPTSATTAPDTNITGTVTYYVYPNGKIYITSTISVVNAQDLSNGGNDLFFADMGLEDPTQLGTGAPDTQGWIRADKDSNPWDNSSTDHEPYVFAYWGPSTPAPYANWTKASIMMVLSPNDTYPVIYPIRHTWAAGAGFGVVRWGYRYVPGPNLSAGQSISSDVMIQLGTQGSSVLPDLTTTATATPIANAYAASPTPPAINVSNSNGGLPGITILSGVTIR